MLFNCIIACFFYSFVVPTDGNPNSFGTTCVRVDSAKNEFNFEREFGDKPNYYRVHDGDVVESYGYGSSTFCRTDNKEEMNLYVLIWGGDYDGAQCR